MIAAALQTRARTGRIEMEAHALEASRSAALRGALETVLSGHTAIRRAIVYAIARDHVVVRLMTGSGWIPVMLAPSDWADAAAVTSRLRTALAHSR